jgi:hypothetical protein
MEGDHRPLVVEPEQVLAAGLGQQLVDDRGRPQVREHHHGDAGVIAGGGVEQAEPVGQVVHHQVELAFTEELGAARRIGGRHHLDLTARDFARQLQPLGPLGLVLDDQHSDREPHQPSQVTGARCTSPVPSSRSSPPGQDLSRSSHSTMSSPSS